MINFIKYVFSFESYDILYTELFRKIHFIQINFPLTLIHVFLKSKYV